MDGATQIMHGSDVLQTMAQIAVAFAGFSGIVAAFNQQGDRWGAADRMRVRSLIVASLAAMFFALLPSGLDVTELAERSIWRTSSAALGLFMVVGQAGGLWMMARMPSEERAQFPRIIAIIVIGGTFMNGAAQLMNAAAWPYETQGAVYIFGVLYQLLLAGALFLRLVIVRTANA